LSSSKQTQNQEFSMLDAIEILLSSLHHLDAETLLAFHRTNRTFLPRVAAEILLLKDSGQKAAGANSVVHFLRYDEHWHGVDHFEVNQNLGALAIRVCTLVWPDLNGMVRFVKCSADKILSTRIVKRGKRRYGNFLAGGPAVVGVVPALPEVKRPRTFHVPITEAEAAEVYSRFEKLVADSSNPRDPALLSWLDHVKVQPEIFVLMDRTLLKRQPAVFSGGSLYEYVRFSIRRAAVRHKRFTLPNRLRVLYSRALIIFHPEFNGRCRFKQDARRGKANRLLGYALAAKPVAGEPYRRLIRVRKEK
jgi:hypothetical protein